MLPEGLFLNLLDQEFDNERIFKNDNEQSNLIKTLLVHGLQTLHNHFSKVTTATPVNDIITVNIMDMNLLRRIVMAQDMDITVDDTVNILLGKKPNIWKNKLEDWLIWILQLPNRNTALTNHSTLQYSKTVQISNRKQARQSLFLSEQPNRHMEEGTDNHDRILLPGETIIETVDGKLYRSIGEENNQEIPVQNVFDTPIEGILLPWNL